MWGVESCVLFTYVWGMQDPKRESSSKYFYAVGEEQFGPHTLIEIIEKIKIGLIKRSTLMWKKGMNEWCSAEKLEETIEAFTEFPPSLPDNSKSQTEGDEKKSKENEKHDSLITNRKRAQTFTYTYTIVYLIACIITLFYGITGIDDFSFFFLAWLFPLTDRIVIRRIYEVRNKKFKYPVFCGFLISTITLIVLMIVVNLIIECTVGVYSN